MRRIPLAAVAALAFLLAIAPAPAQQDGFTPVALNIDSASRALDAMSGVHAVAQAYENEFPEAASGDMLDSLSGLATYAAARAELDQAVGPHGFSGYSDWVAVVTTVFHAYAYVQSAPMRQQMGPMMDQAMQQMLNNPNIPQAQKDAIMAQIGAAGGAEAAMAANAPSPENQAVVSELGPRIEEVVNQMR